MGFPWFVFVLGIFPTLFAFTHNYGEAASRDIVLPLLVGLGTAVVLLGLLFPVRRDWRSAGVAAAVLIGWFITFDIQWMLLQQLPVVPSKLQAVPVTGVAALLLAGAILWRLREPDRLVRRLNIFAFILLGFNALQLGATVVGTPEVEGVPPVEWPDRRAADGEIAEPPRDIYYIVLDGYARTDVLREFYGYDNADFIRSLERAGFHVFENARANYAKTYLSLASTLNGRYLDDVAAQARERPDTPDRLLAAMMIRDNAVMTFLKQRGYTIYSFQTAWGPTERLATADVNIECGFSSGREFYRLLLSYTAAWPLSSRVPRLLDDYDLQRCLLDRLLRIHEEPSPKFVFAHLLTPHPPAIFGPDGEPAEGDPMLLGDDGGWAHEEGYVGEVRFISRYIERLVDTLRAAGEPEPIIVVQGDHGPASSGWDSPDIVRERMPILHALYLPGVDSVPRSELITPVNTFRFVLSEYHGVARELLPNHSYYSDSDDPWTFVRVDSLWASVDPE